MKRMIKGITITAAAVAMSMAMSMTAFAAGPAGDNMQGQQPPAQGQAPQDNAGQPQQQGDGNTQGNEAPPEKPVDDAGAALSSGEVPEKPVEEAPKDGERPAEVADMTSILEELLGVIDDLEDEEVKENLTELYDAFVAALDAEKEALEDDSTSEDTIEELKEAVETARDELTSALTEAGIYFDLEPKEGENPQALEEGKEAQDTPAPKDAEPAVNEDGSADESVDKTSPIKKIGNAIVSFFSKLFKKSE